MLTKPQYTVHDWLDLHGLTSKEVQGYCGAIAQTFRLSGNFSPRESANSLAYDLEYSLEQFVLPAFEWQFGLTADENQTLSKVKFTVHRTDGLDLPFTEWDEKLKAPSVHLVWSGTPDDLICLAHEMAHAAQMLLSKGAFMPPVARETCAFLGELALIQYVKVQSVAVYRDLQAVWHRESHYYLGSDVVQLLDDLNADSSPYQYRHNYPLARVSAMFLFSRECGEGRKKLLASGTEAMAQLSLPAVVQDMQRSSVQHTAHHKTHEADEDIAAFQMSLSPQALEKVRTEQIDYAWLYHPSNGGCVVGNSIDDLSSIRAHQFVQWRSFGIFALSALRSGSLDTLPEQFLQKYEWAAKEPANLTSSFSKPWIKMMGFDALTALGLTIQCLATSPYHRQFKLNHYLPVEILPPLKAGQLQCYLAADGSPVGCVTWAWLRDSLLEDIHISGRALDIGEWSGGSNLFCNDWITSPTAFKQAISHMRNDMFPNKIASSIRRNPDGSVRRVNKWVGRGLHEAHHHLSAADPSGLPQNELEK